MGEKLYEIIDGKAYKLRLPFPEIPEYVLQNLKHDLDQIYWGNNLLNCKCCSLTKQHEMFVL